MQFSPDVNQSELRAKVNQIFGLGKKPTVFVRGVFNTIKITNNNFQRIREEKIVLTLIEAFPFS